MSFISTTRSIISCHFDLSVQVSAKTSDGTADVIYGLKSSSANGLNFFEINEISGEIKVKNDTTDAETVNLYTLVVEAQDRRLDPIRLVVICKDKKYEQNS